MNGQKCVLHAISPNSRVIQAELLTEEKPHPIVFIPRINFTATVGRKGIYFSRVQFPLRPAYAMTINKSQGQTLTRIDRDLRSSPFAHGQLYVALSRAQNKLSIMCLIPPSQVFNGVLYTDNIVYCAFIEAATSIVTLNNPPSPPSAPPPAPPPSPPDLPYWLFQPEVGDGACGFRAIARHFLGNPDLHLQIREQVVQYISQNRDDSDLLRTYEGIGIEVLYASGLQPSTYNSYDDYLARMSLPYTYMGQPELTAVSAIFGKEIHVHFDHSTLPPPDFATTQDIHLRYTQLSRHYDTFKLIIPDAHHQPPPATGGGPPSSS